MNILRISLGIIFIWFGFLKFFHGLSAAELLAGRTIYVISSGWLKPAVSMPILAVWECAIGIGLVTGFYTRLTLTLLYIHLTGTFLPLVLFPQETWTHTLFVPTLLGQYILKNCVLISAGIVIGCAMPGAKPSYQMLKKVLRPEYPLYAAEHRKAAINVNYRAGNKPGRIT